MSADDWLDCPECGAEDSVRVDSIYDYDLLPDHKLKAYIRGYWAYCTECKYKWDVE